MSGVSIQLGRKDNLGDIIRRSPVAGVAGAEDIINECMFRSIEVRYGLLDGEVACMWGIIPPTLLSDTAYLWLLTTDIVAEHKFLFVRHSQVWIQSALKRWPRIIGDCVIGNHQAIRWLRWLGAEFGEPFMGRVPFIIQAKHG